MTLQFHCIVQLSAQWCCSTAWPRRTTHPLLASLQHHTRSPETEPINYRPKDRPQPSGMTHDQFKLGESKEVSAESWKVKLPNRPGPN